MSFQVIPVPAFGAEDVVVGAQGPDEGAVFTGTEDGSIFRISHDGNRIDRVAQTGGRPLGIEIDLDGRLLVCDAHLGVLRIDTGSGAVESVTDSVAGRKMVFCNNAAIAVRRDGLVLGLLDEVRRGAVEGRLRPEHPHRAAAEAVTRWRGRGGPRRAGLRQRRGAVPQRGLRGRGGVGRAHRRTPMADRQPRRDARPAVPEPAGLPRQHRPRQRRPDLGDHRQPHRRPRRAPPEVADAGCARR